MNGKSERSQTTLGGTNSPPRRLSPPRRRDDPEFDRLVEALAALADPTRLSLLCATAGAPGGACPIGDLPEQVDRSQPTVSYHLRRLSEAGLIHRVRDGKTMTAHVDVDFLATLGDCLGDAQYLARLTANLPRPSVLFLCTHNAGRSQMAAGWLRHLTNNAVDVYSGGSEPASTLNYKAVAAMARVGIDISSESPAHWTPELAHSVDVIVSMGCGDSCPTVQGQRYVAWQLDDPATLSQDEVCRVRDQIRSHVEDLVVDLGVRRGFV